MRQRPRRGFTLLELLMVIAILGALVAFAWPDFNDSTRSQQLQESAYRMQALVAMCRAEAMNESKRFRLLIRQDGTLRVEQQLDPLLAPNEFVSIDGTWSHNTQLLEDVWVEGIQLLPEGPPPIRVEDDHLVFPETEVEVQRVEDLEKPLEIDFEPDGSSNSLRWILRDTRGRALLLTLDGRLGRVGIEDWEAVAPDTLRRPEPLVADKDQSKLEREKKRAVEEKRK